MEQVFDSLAQFWQFTGFANCTWQHLVMIVIGIGFITIRRDAPSSWGDKSLTLRKLPRYEKL